MELKYTDHDAVLKLLATEQDNESDMREAVREAHHFIDKRDGQWEPDIIQRMKGRPRYTFDKCNPIVDQIAGELEEADFSIKVRPAGGEASKETAKTLDGLIRNIRNISNGDHIFNASGRSMITGGFDAWEVVQDWVDADAFDQDLFIRKIPNAVDRVWFDSASEMQDRSDARYAFVLQVLTKQQYEAKFPKGSAQSIGDDKVTDVYYNKPDFITVGKILYKKPRDIEIVRTNDGKVYNLEQFEEVKEELEAQGIIEEKRRTRKSWRVHSRVFDGGDWLTGEEETVFDYIPVVPTYGNFKISENKVIYRGIVEKLMDPQRVINYAESRKIEEGALAPRGKYWLSREQAENDTTKLATLNTNSDPVQTYTHVDGQPAPFWQGGAQINPGLQDTAMSADAALQAAAGLFAANMGNNPGLQSGVAIEKQIDKGNQGTIKWFNSQEVAICHTAKVLINAIPRIYDSTRQVRILAEDGTSEMITLNTNISKQTGKMPDGTPIIENVELNNLALGEYDVACEIGPAFKNRQQETASAFLEMAAINPELTQRGMDVWLSNLSAPGMDIMADRFRQSLLDQQAIPFEQMSPEEQQKAQQAAQQPPQPDAMMVAAEAEAQKAQADQMEAQNKQLQIQTDAQLKQQDQQIRMMEIQLKQQEFERAGNAKFNIDAAKIQQGSRKLDIDEQKIALSAEDQRFSQTMDIQNQMIQALNTQADTLNKLKDAMGADTIVSDKGVQAYSEQTEIVQDSQDEQS